MILALAFGVPVASALEVHDLVYAAPDGHELVLDLDLPDEIKEPVPLVIMIHGGGWSSGSRSNFTAPELVEDGFAVATIDYRLSPEFVFPAHIQVVKAAIRFQRAP